MLFCQNEEAFKTQRAAPLLAGSRVVANWGRAVVKLVRHHFELPVAIVTFAVVAAIFRVLVVDELSNSAASHHPDCRLNGDDRMLAELPELREDLILHEPGVCRGGAEAVDDVPADLCGDDHFRADAATGRRAGDQRIDERFDVVLGGPELKAGEGTGDVIVPFEDAEPVAVEADEKVICSAAEAEVDDRKTGGGGGGGEKGEQTVEARVGGHEAPGLWGGGSEKRTHKDIIKNAFCKGNCA